MSRYFTSSVAAAALIAALAGPVLAQPAGNPPENTQSQNQAAVQLPDALRDAGLTDLASKATRHGERVTGKLPGGAELAIMLDDNGELRGLRAQNKAALPRDLVERLVPPAVRNQQIFGELGQIDAIFTGDRGVMLAGKDAQSNSVRAAFAEDGTLMRFGRGDDDDRGPGMGPDGGRHHRDGKGRERDGDHGPRHRGDRDHGDRDHGDRGPRDRDHGDRGPRDRDHGDRADRGQRGPGDDGPRNDRRGPDGGPDRGNRDAGRQPLGPDAVRSSLTQAGYTGVGQILQQGRVTVAQATNPEGEAVLVEIAPNGRVVRELNR